MLGALDTPKVSDKHLVTRLPSVPSPPVPPISLFTDAVSVAGPVITKVSKSSRIWQILVLALQIWAEHPPVGAVVSSKYVQFSVELDPQPNVTKYIKTIYYMESIRLTRTVKELKDWTNRTVWSKTTLITGGVGGAGVDPPSWRNGYVFS